MVPLPVVPPGVLLPEELPPPVVLPPVFSPDVEPVEVPVEVPGALGVVITGVLVLPEAPPGIPLVGSL